MWSNGAMHSSARPAVEQRRQKITQTGEKRETMQTLNFNDVSSEYKQ